MIKVLREEQLPEHEVRIGQHIVACKDNTFKCKQCDLGAHVPELIIRDGPKSTQIYMYYILGAIFHFTCEAYCDSSDNGSVKIANLGIQRAVQNNNIITGASANAISEQHKQRAISIKQNELKKKILGR